MSKCVLAFALSLCCSPACAQHVSLKPYWTAAAAAGAATTVDFVTTTQFLAATNKACNMEGGTAWLYSHRPYDHQVRVGVLMFGELAVTSTASYLLRRHRSRFWIVPLGYTAISHGQAAARNFYFCR